MADVTYKGTTIPFGRVQGHLHDLDLKTWGFPGVDGLDVMAMGKRGRVFAVVGRSVNGGISKATLPTMAGMVAAISGLMVSVQLERFARAEGKRVADRLTVVHG